MRILQQLDRGGGIQSVDDLAQTLGVSPQLLRTMLDDLTRRGYLQPLVTGCTQPCISCPLSGYCQLKARQNIWSLTEKGRRALQHSLA